MNLQIETACTRSCPKLGCLTKIKARPNGQPPLAYARFMLGMGFQRLSSKQRGLLASAVLTLAWVTYLVGSRAPTAAASNAAASHPSPARASKPLQVTAAEPAPRPTVLTLLPVTVTPERHLLDALSPQEIDSLLLHAPERLGSATIGRPNRGRLFNGVRLEPSVGIRIVDAASSFGTRATVHAIQAAIAEVQRQFPGSPLLPVGDLSRKGGGYLRPHRSHQTGVDVDIGYYYQGSQGWYTPANAQNLDRARTWALLKAFVAHGNVEYIFMDRSIQALLREFAEKAQESPTLLEALFQTRNRPNTLVRHERRHVTHLHVRFVDPSAEAAGRRLSPRLRRLGRP